MKKRLSFNNQHRGFTLIELVMVIVIAGLLATYAIPRFFNQDSFENRGFYSEVINAVRYAQQLAVAINCNTQVALASNNYTVTIDNNPAACGSGGVNGAAPSPVTGQLGFSGNSTSVGITINSGPAIFQFDALGKATSDVDVSIGGYQFLVHASTGYIQEL